MTTRSQKINDPEPESTYFLNANPKYPIEGHYNVDKEGKKCYAFSKDIEEQHMGKPQMTCTFDITFLKRLYRFIIDNKAIWKEGNSHLKYERILKVSGAILHYFNQFIKKFGQKLSKEIEYYEGIFIYLLTYYVNLQSWDKSYYFKAMFSFKLRTNPFLFLKTDGGIIYEFSKWLLDVISENGKVYIEFIKRCCDSKKEVLYIKNHPILPDRYFDQEFDTSDQAEKAKIMELLDGKFKIVYYCNPSGKEEENTLGKIGLSKVNKRELVFDAYSVEVFDWPPEDDRRISIECRSFHNMIYLSYRKLLRERLDNFDELEEDIEKTDKEVEEFIEVKNGEAYHCGHLYSLIKLLFKYIFSDVFKGEKNFVFGIEFETSLLIYSLVYNDRKPIWESDHHSGPRVTVTSEIVQTVKKHLPYKDGKYYDCYGNYAAYTVDNPNDALRCIYALEGQIGIFTVDLSRPDYDLTIVKEYIDQLCVFITRQKTDPETVVEKMFTCPEEKRRERSPRREKMPATSVRERTPPPRFNSKKSKKKSKKTPKKSLKTSKKKSKKTPKKINYI
jgi:hypothetical protein